jgi:glycosyltransferase involved in cell wall biosynthesis
MAEPGLPLVSVVTPFYNTAAYLAQCIESVLGQSYRNWEYLLVDNCSTDGSAEIAQRYAQRDARIRLVRNERFVGQVDNYNGALALISGNSKYCKMVQADDWIYPGCLEKMVAAAERHPAAGLVAAYYLKGDFVAGGPRGGTPDTELYDGREVCRMKLRSAGFYTGSPTAVMYRADLVRSRHPFFPTGRYHEDLDVVYAILEQHALAFVPQVLTVERTGNPSILTKARTFNTGILDRLLEVETYADRFLPPGEAGRVKRQARRQYFAFLGRGALVMRERPFWEYHFRGLETIGWKSPYLRVAGAALWQAIKLALNPLEAIRGFSRLVRRRP